MKELGFLLTGGVLFLAATGFDGYNTEQQMNSEDSATVERDHMSLSERLGYAILIRAGYATVELPPEDELKLAPSLRLAWHSDHPDFRCIDPMVRMGTGNRDQVDPFLLLASIVAAEKYNRSAFIRNSEELIARSILSLSGGVPDFSLGVSQIRPSIIRAGVDQAVGDVGLSDREVLDLALSDCTNVVAADRYVRGLIAAIDPATPKYDIVAQVARRYVGAAGTGENGETYQSAVGGAYRLLEIGLYGYESGESDQIPPAGFLGCITFPVGEPTGRFTDGILELLPDAETVTLGFADREPGPADYRTRMAQLRHDWMLQQMREAGVPADHVTIAPPVDKWCGGSSLSSASVFMSPPPEGSGEGESVPEN
jgi:hypothetical protein